ncbi:Regulator of sigma E protease,zinc metallopeptidase RseP,Translation elongation factor Ts,RIP metalloprotease RseP,Peptidase family M50 [Chlamydia poikilotherma]|uniref:Regulator of sigma E protease,zinc metallopeptidase RseP,Translation elongation factor Ts,RIP metalloprotease RseP,Peptidase family M50 n=1 Tax=Chlamydia poikilotherma TaxID=1967783 RepID=A0A3B0PZY2_9CHLA|nr:site-2 protease family protein [Chlamydia poikilotherma]SYX08925.1 Regulator of sigma E protease,zinc metallopeptidase RseP,Translation elongation factor Ts,RIP metalloprotease RseP,Peptidase family M50 [Chlamydia poikilotherma]
MTIIYFILAALALGVLVLIHELGHLLAAKSVGMAVESFSIGFGPALYKKKIGNIEYRVGIFPFGGYVRIKGMDKREKGIDADPDSVYDIPQGFFSKSPWKRIIVLAAGPIANILLAFVAFGALYISGGRNKAYSEYSRIVGWVNPILKEKGLNLGDEILTCNGKPYYSDKDALTSALLDRHLSFRGVHPAYLSKTSTEFSLDTEFNVNKDGIPLAGASYLLYRHQEPISKESPMYSANILPGDRLVWMDGQILFSPMQVSQILNEAYAFVKVSRYDKELSLRIPRMLASTLYLSPYVRNELIDNQYEAGIKGKWSSLYTLPYMINSYGYVEGELQPIDPESPFPPMEDKLELGDRILAIDGTPVSGSTDILRLVQNHKVSIIIQKMSSEQLQDVDSSIADERFIRSYDPKNLLAIVNSIGSAQEVRESGQYRLLSPIQPKPWISIYSDDLLNKRREMAKKFKNQDQQRYYLDRIEIEKQKLSLGIPLKDMTIKYNPTPDALIINISKDSLRTMKALVVGRLNPQWLSGPVGIVHMLHKGWSLGVSEALFWIGLVSINLAVLNLLPIPVLDGGYILLCLWEMISRRRLNMKLIEKMLIPFSLLLIAFFIFLTFQDLFRFFAVS